MHNSNEVTQSVHKYTFHQPKNTNSLTDTVDITIHMVFAGELAVKLYVDDAEVETRCG